LAFQVTQTNDVDAIVLGPYTAGQKGDNRLYVDDVSTRFLVENDADATVFQAADNYWYLENDAVSPTVISQILSPSYTQSAIDSRNVATPAASVANWDRADPGNPSCLPGRPPDAPRTFVPPLVAPAPGEPSQVMASYEDALGPPCPNPSRGMVEVALTVSPDRTGEYRLEVFDVRGRRVLLAERRFPLEGRYMVSWAGRDHEGNRVASGTYFLRLTAPGVREVRKVTIVW
jgi:hypothetical protein